MKTNGIPVRHDSRAPECATVAILLLANGGCGPTRADYVGDWLATDGECHSPATTDPFDGSDPSATSIAIFEVTAGYSVQRVSRDDGVTEYTRTCPFKRGEIDCGESVVYTEAGWLIIDGSSLDRLREESEFFDLGVFPTVCTIWYDRVP